MSINHAKTFLKSFHTVGFFSWPFSETLNFYFKMGGRFFKKILGSNHYYWLVLWLVKWAPESKNLASPLILTRIRYIIEEKNFWIVATATNGKPAIFKYSFLPWCCPNAKLPYRNVFIHSKVTIQEVMSCR